MTDPKPLPFGMYFGDNVRYIRNAAEHADTLIVDPEVIGNTGTDFGALAESILNENSTELYAYTNLLAIDQYKTYGGVSGFNLLNEPYVIGANAEFGNSRLIDITDPEAYNLLLDKALEVAGEFPEGMTPTLFLDDCDPWKLAYAIANNVGGEQARILANPNASQDVKDLINAGLSTDVLASRLAALYTEELTLLAAEIVEETGAKVIINNGQVIPDLSRVGTPSNVAILKEFDVVTRDGDEEGILGALGDGYRLLVATPDASSEVYTDIQASAPPFDTGTISVTFNGNRSYMYIPALNRDGSAVIQQQPLRFGEEQESVSVGTSTPTPTPTPAPRVTLAPRVTPTAPPEPSPTSPEETNELPPIEVRNIRPLILWGADGSRIVTDYFVALNANGHPFVQNNETGEITIHNFVDDATPEGSGFVIIDDEGNIIDQATLEAEHPSAINNPSIPIRALFEGGVHFWDIADNPITPVNLDVTIPARTSETSTNVEPEAPAIVENDEVAAVIKALSNAFDEKGDESKSTFTRPQRDIIRI
jgi:hypothetical protein